MLDGHPDARSRTDAAIPVSRGHLLPTAFGLALLAMPLMARAQARPTAHLLVVRSPEVMGCPSDDELREQVAARLGRDPFAPEEGEVRAEVRLGRDGRVHVARVLVSAGDTLGERSLRDRDCGELVEAVAVVLAVLLTDASTPPPPTSIEAGTADAPEEWRLENARRSGQLVRGLTLLADKDLTGL